MGVRPVEPALRPRRCRGLLVLSYGDKSKRRQVNTWRRLCW
ncbi:hypothetical protein J2W56_002003 [Nocardia kruczakiae]|uniref:Uncharacterized protein n=1 Tax=Nocardia kruczakiae TaxID=261477 RepID=A0ABU1XE29_9NOCA|nr:hypothetical protein [Nocardia kruczakiae]